MLASLAAVLPISSRKASISRSGAKATRSRTSSGAVLWLIPIAINGVKIIPSGHADKLTPYYSKTLSIQGFVSYDKSVSGEP